MDDWIGRELRLLLENPNVTSANHKIMWKLVLGSYSRIVVFLLGFNLSKLCNPYVAEFKSLILRKSFETSTDSLLYHVH